MNYNRHTICGVYIKNGITTEEYNKLYNLIIIKQNLKDRQFCQNCNKFYKKIHKCKTKNDNETYNKICKKISLQI